MNLSNHTPAFKVSPNRSAYEREPRNLHAAAQSACYCAGQMGRAIVVVPVGSGYRLATERDRLSYVTGETTQVRVLVVQPNGSCQHADAI